MSSSSAAFTQSSDEKVKLYPGSKAYCMRPHDSASEEKSVSSVEMAKTMEIDSTKHGNATSAESPIVASSEENDARFLRSGRQVMDEESNRQQKENYSKRMQRMVLERTCLNARTPLEIVQAEINLFNFTNNKNRQMNCANLEAWVAEKVQEGQKKFEDDE